MSSTTCTSDHCLCAEESLTELVERKAREALAFGETDKAIALLARLVDLKAAGF